MKNRWSDKEAQSWIVQCDGEGVNEELALRIYTARLLGQDQNLVLHGGGNTSLKSQLPDPLGVDREVMFIKGSGWDLATMQAPGLPAVWLEPLRQLQVLKVLDDLSMADLLRSNLLNSRAPNPSVETLLHAFVPHRVVDHTHASAVLALSDQSDGDEICGEIFAGKAAIVPYAMSGLRLAKKVAEISLAHADVRGLILSKHGLVCYGDTAQASYETMIELVNVAETFLNWGRPKNFPSIELPSVAPTIGKIAPSIRGAIARVDKATSGSYRRVLLEHRGGKDVLKFVNGQDLKRYAQAGVVTPDHAIRTKGWPLIFPPIVNAKAISDAVRNYAEDYATYYLRHARSDTTMLDPLPKVILMPGVGLFAAGRTATEVSVVADIAEKAIAIIGAAESYGRFESISEEELFAIEYWSLEQAKLQTPQEPSFAGQVAVITGGAGAIGAATARAFYDEGAAIVLLDLDVVLAKEIAADMGGIGLECDVTDFASVTAIFDTICKTYGGIDILVSNAGAAWQGKIGEVDDSVLRQSFDLNFFGHQNVAKATVAIMTAQGTGGSLLFNASKQAVNPGPNFGPYGLPKAATLSLMRQYAVDYGDQGIRANGVNADRVRSGLLTDKMVAARSEARGLSEVDYMVGNLLRQEVKAEDVAQAFVNLAKSDRTTGAILTVDGGNIAAALR